jgi:hypothetical protein
MWKEAGVWGVHSKFKLTPFSQKVTVICFLYWLMANPDRESPMPLAGISLVCSHTLQVHLCTVAH